MSGLFKGKSVGTGHWLYLKHWDVSNVTDMSNMFRDFWGFTIKVGSWNVSNVTNMSNMFRNARGSYIHGISNWNVSSVTNMDYMFYDADAFDQDISGWCVSKINTKPKNFATGSWLKKAYMPVWGACPENDNSSRPVTL